MCYRRDIITGSFYYYNFIVVTGAVTPALESIKEMMSVPTDSSGGTPLQQSVAKMNQKIGWHLKSSSEAIKGRIRLVGSAMHKMSDFVGDAINDLSDPLKKPLQSAGKALNAGSGKIGTVITKAGGTLSAISIAYAGYKLGEAITQDPPEWDSALEQGLVLAGSFVSLAATYAAAGSMLGPIGAVAGVVIGLMFILYYFDHKQINRFIFSRCFGVSVND